MKMYMNGQACNASDGKVLAVTNPATGEVIDTVPAATREDVDRIIANSLAGQKEWAAYPLYRRIEILRKFVSLVMEEKTRKEMSLVLCREMGKPLQEAYNDFQVLYDYFDGFIASAKNNLGGETIPFGVETGREKDFIVSIREPLGTILCILSFNGPVALFAKKAAPALLAGNSVIMKPASDDPLTVLMLSELMLKAGVPGNAFQTITGGGGTVGNWLTADPRIAGVTFTGSTEVGVQIAENLSKNLKFQSLELGGNAPFVVFSDANVDIAVKEALFGRASYLTGQLCNVSKRFIIHKSLKEEFMEKLIAELKKIKIGDPMAPETQMGTLISEKAAKQVESQVNLTVEQGAKLVYGGKRNGAFYTPAVLDNVTGKMDIAHDMEVFGPVFPIMEFDTVEDAIRMANDTKYGLGAAAFTKDMKLAMKAATEMESGCVVINGQSFYRNMVLPFGGYKNSGVGREGQVATLLAMTQNKNIVFKGIMD